MSTRSALIFGSVFCVAALGACLAEAKKRFKLTHVKSPNDKNYIYLKIEPKNGQDNAGFVEARLTLWSATMLPRQFWMRYPTGNEVTWDIPRLDTGATVRPAEFAVKLPGADWRFVRLPEE